jgi:hypothetical protein
MGEGERTFDLLILAAKQTGRQGRKGEKYYAE